MRPRGTTSRRVFVALLTLTAAAAINAGLDRPGAPRETAAGLALGTSLWSPRRTPQLVVDAVGAQHLQRDLEGAAGPNRACFQVEDAVSRTPIAGLERDSPLAPASTMKLITAIAALDALGTDFRFTTAVTPSRPPRDGIVDRLFLVGGGDPLLATPERIAVDASDPETAGLAATNLATLADAIAAAGIRAVPEGVTAVDTHYDATRYLDVWPASVRSAIGPVGALTVNDGFTGAAGTGAVASDPALNAAAELSRLLEARGVPTGTPGRADAAPDGSVVASVESPPLPEVLTEMLSASDNLTAEMLVRELGRGPGPPQPVAASKPSATDSARSVSTSPMRRSWTDRGLLETAGSIARR